MNSHPILQRNLTELDEWLAPHEEDVLDPGLPIIDAHHHMWWRPPESYQLPELMGDIGSGHNVRGTVFVQCTAMYRADGPEELRPVGETEYVNGVAAISASGMFGDVRLCAGIVGYADLRLGEQVVEVLEAHVRAGGARFKGIRQQAQHDDHIGPLAKVPPPRGLLNDQNFRRGFASLSPLGLSFDAWIYFKQLPEIVELAQSFPETQIIINHIGAPLGIGYYAHRRGQVFEEWARHMSKAASCPNISVKLGGMGMAAYGFGFSDRSQPTPSPVLAAAWKPYIMHCIESFGVDRCMFESNFPVDKQSCSYRTLWNAFKIVVAGASNAEKRALFFDTARRVYRLGDIAPKSI